MVVAGAPGWRKGKADVRGDLSRRKAHGGRGREEQPTKEEEQNQKENSAHTGRRRMPFQRWLFYTVRTANEEYFPDSSMSTFCVENFYFQKFLFYFQPE